MKKQSSKKKKKSQKKTAAPKSTAAPAKKTAPKEEKKVLRKTAEPVPRKKAEKKGADENVVAKYIKKSGQFLREARMELKKVKWPTRKELFASTAVVIVLSLLVAFFLGMVDFGLIKIIKNIVG